MDLLRTPASVGEAVTRVDSLLTKGDSARAATTELYCKKTKRPRDAVEVLIPDSRAELSPAQSVEHKLTSMLRGATIPVSHIRMAKLCGRP